MAQLHFYIPDQLAEKVKAKAEHSHLTVSKYLANLIKKEVANDWPEGYFELFGSWEGDALQRPEQGDFENREELK
ncbi:MAG: hypothetical protein L3J59_16335 [Methylococcaceae bacterium]|nr:hypothetical protein [Methylococcaceae bacterium]